MGVTHDTNQAPPGATHILPADPLGFDQRPTWMKWGYDFTGPESGQMFCCWYSWDRGEWKRDKSFHPRENTVLLTVAEFLSRNTRA